MSARDTHTPPPGLDDALRQAAAGSGARPRGAADAFPFGPPIAFMRRLREALVRGRRVADPLLEAPPRGDARQEGD
jgi:hypothetical protein